MRPSSRSRWPSGEAVVTQITQLSFCIIRYVLDVSWKLNCSFDGRKNIRFLSLVAVSETVPSYIFLLRKRSASLRDRSDPLSTRHDLCHNLLDNVDFMRAIRLLDFGVRILALKALLRIRVVFPGSNKSNNKKFFVLPFLYQQISQNCCIFEEKKKKLGPIYKEL